MRLKANTGYAQTLRVIGQVLDSLQADSFQLVCEGDNYIIRDITEPADQIHRNGSGRKNKTGSRFPELRLTPADIAQMDNKGRTKRRLDEGLPEAESLSNILRAAGNEVDLAGGSLVEITKKNHQQIEMVYGDREGKTHAPTMEIADLYAAFVRTYLNRADRRPSSYSQA